MRAKYIRAFFASLKLSDLILLATSLHLSVGVITHTFWLVKGNQRLFHYYFGYEDPIFLFLCAVLEFVVARAAWKQFSPGQPLRRAWLFIMVSSSCHLLGNILSHILSWESDINPLYALDISWRARVEAGLSRVGTFIGGPVQMFTLAIGLFITLRVCRKYGAGKKSMTDWIILAAVSAYTLHVATVLVRTRLLVTPLPGFNEVLNWGNDPLLCVLLFLAVFLRRAVADMGWGYVSKCWGAYVVAILGTSAASMVMWATSFGLFPYPQNAFLWYIWPIIFAAYALGPTYQLEAVHTALARLEQSTPKPEVRVA